MNPHGWKTYLAGAIAIATGVVAITDGKYYEGAAGVVSGLGLVGFRSAAAKIIKALNEIKQRTS